MFEQETIEHYQKLLDIYRRNLHHLLEQVALHGGIANVSLEIANNLERTRADIRRAKEILRANDVTVVDQPGEQELAEDHSANFQLAAHAYAHQARNRLGLRLIVGLLATLVLLTLWHSGAYTSLFLPRLLPSTAAEKAEYDVSSQIAATGPADWTSAPSLVATTNPTMIAGTTGGQRYFTNQSLAASPAALVAPLKTPEPQPAISTPEPQPSGAPAATVPANPPTATKEPPKATQALLQATPAAMAQIIACVQIDRLSVKQEQLTSILSGEPRFRVVALFGPVEGITEEHKTANTVPTTPGEEIAGQQIEPRWKICEPINSYLEAGNTVRLQIQASVITPDNQAHAADISPIEGESLNLTLQLAQTGFDCSIWQVKDDPKALSGNCGNQIQAIGGNTGPISSDVIPAVGIWFTVTLNTI